MPQFAIKITTKTGETGFIQYLSPPKPMTYPTLEKAQSVALQYTFTDRNGVVYDAVEFKEDDK